MKNAPITKDYLALKIQNILDNNHKESEKRKIRFYPKNINFACPYCGDSDKILSKKRAYVYLNTVMFQCFNCEKRTSFVKFCEDFHEEVDVENKIKIYNHVDNNIYSKTDYKVTSMDKLIDLDKFLNFVNTNKKSWITDVKPVEKNSRVYQYLTFERNMLDHSGIYQGIYQKFRDGKRVFYTPVLINMNMSGNKLLGIQLRNLEKDKTKRFFKIVDFEELYNFINPGKPIDEIEAIPYNKLSHFYNILNVNFDDWITVFEGYIDSKFCTYGNSIGLIGLNSGKDLLKFLTDSDEGLKLRFFYDNDDDGLRRSIELLEQGHKVFLWKKFIKDYLDKCKNRSRMEKVFTYVKDLNDLAIVFRNDKVFNDLNLNDYFSIDEFDMIWLKVRKVF